MKTVYVAGPISANNLLDALENIRQGQIYAVAVMDAGYAPFCPHIDYQFAFHKRLPLERYYAYSMAWLERSDAVLFIGDWESSKGACSELERATELKKPVFFTLDELVRDFPA